jgi:CHASE2 domain-containing sensor protein
MTPEQILAGLRDIANNWRGLAVIWHAYFAVLACGLLVGARPSRRVVGILLTVPLLSVSALAWLSGNPVNGTFFSLTGIGLLAIAVHLPRTRIHLV